MEQLLFKPAQLATTTFTPRPYQADSIKCAVDFFAGTKIFHGVLVLPTGAGKSIVIANIAKELEGNTLVLQPSKEILEQNHAKFCSYGFRASIYSASVGEKRISKVTFATIGSIASKHHLFADFKNIIVDECHLVNPKAGMYNDFIHSIENCKVLGLTATPYRLSNGLEGAMLKFITRTRPKIFKEVLYVVQPSVLFEAGYLAKLQYFSFDVIDRKLLKTNTSGTDFTEASLKALYKKINFPQLTAYWANRIIKQRKNLLIFSSMIEEANRCARMVVGSVVITGATKKAERERILSDFKKGKIKVLINIGVLTTGFDYPELEAVLIARSTMSLALYYQIVGRAMRIHPDKKDAWIVDLGGNINFFGKIETMDVTTDAKGLWCVKNNGRQLTNVNFEKV